MALGSSGMATCSDQGSYSFVMDIGFQIVVT